MLFVLEILYKPFVTIFGNVITIKLISVLNFVWFAFVIIYFILFVLIFFQCSKVILYIRIPSDAKKNGYLIEEINKDVFRKTIVDRIKYRDVDLLYRDFKYLRCAIQDDNNDELQYRYDRIINSILEEYIERKEHEISLMEKGKILSYIKKCWGRNQKHWWDNQEYEKELIKEVLEKKYFELNATNLKNIWLFNIELLKLDMLKAKLDGYNKICDDNLQFSMNIDKEFDVSEWKDITIKIYKSMDDENRKKLVNKLYRYAKQEKELFSQYCISCIKSLITLEIDYIIDNNRQKEFIVIFDNVLRNNLFEECYIQKLTDIIVSNKEINIEELVKRLSGENCTFLFTYVIMYYSIYRDRFEWKYINIEMLTRLWKNHGSMREDEEVVIKKSKNQISVIDLKNRCI